MSKFYSSMLLMFLLIFGFMTNTSAATNPVQRIDGANRFDVAVNISKQGWPNGANTVVLVNYDAFADALSATPLAAQYNAPILLTPAEKLTDTIGNEIKRLNPSKVVIVGGEGSVSNTVIDDVKALGITNVTRISGSNRFDVANRIANLMPSSNKVVVAYGLNFPDALAIAPYAAKNGYPILLTESNVLPDQTQAALNSRQPQSTIVVGGEGSITPKVYNQLPNPSRIDGRDRYEVAANVLRTFKMGTDSANIATGNTFADALTGSVLAAKQGTGILLTQPNELPSATSNVIKELGFKNFVVLGGPASVTQNVVDQLLGKNPTPPPAKGPLAGLKLVIDAGHGGADPGAIGNGLREKDVVIDIAKRIKPKLESAGATVIMTRESDVLPSLNDRVVIANNAKANAFVSVHINSFSSSSAYGTETWWNSQYFGNESKALAQAIQTQLVNNMGTFNRGVKEGDFYVIKNSKMPSVLAEVAFISNSEDAKKLADSNYREKAANAIYQGILNYYK